MFLPRLELQTLTGRKQPAALCRVLRREGFLFKISAAGHPVVLLEEVQAKMGTPAPLWNRRAAGPEFDAL